VQFKGNSTSLEKAVQELRSTSRVKGQFKGRYSSSSEKAVQESRGSSKAIPVSAQRRQFHLEFRSLGSLTVWLDQEEASVQ
jgi:hypothetical protein